MSPSELEQDATIEDPAYLVWPQLTIGEMGHTVNVDVSASSTVWPDHDDFVDVALVSPPRVKRAGQPHVLASQTRVRKNKHSIEACIRLLAADVAPRLDREARRASGLRIR